MQEMLLKFVTLYCGGSFFSFLLTNMKTKCKQQYGLKNLANRGYILIAKDTARERDGKKTCFFPVVSVSHCNVASSVLYIFTQY